MFTSRRKTRVTMEFEVPKRHVFKAYIIHRYGPMGFTVGETKEAL